MKPAQLTDEVRKIIATDSSSVLKSGVQVRIGRIKKPGSFGKRSIPSEVSVLAAPGHDGFDTIERSVIFPDLVMPQKNNTVLMLYPNGGKQPYGLINYGKKKFADASINME
jgi:hypothetical protein